MMIKAYTSASASTDGFARPVCGYVTMRNLKLSVGSTLLAALLLCGSPSVSVGQVTIIGEDTTALDAFLASFSPVQFDPNDTTLTNSQRQRILAAHATAMAQVDAALTYLRVNAASILNGTDGFYNQTFGQFYDPFFFDPTGNVFAQRQVDAGLVDLVNPIGVGDFNGGSLDFVDVTVSFFGVAQTALGTAAFGSDSASLVTRPVYTGQTLDLDTVFVDGRFLLVGEPDMPGVMLEATTTAATTVEVSGGQMGGAMGMMGAGGVTGIAGLTARDVLVLQSLSLVDPLEDLDLMGPPDDDDDVISLFPIFNVPFTTSVANLDHYQQVVSTFEDLRSALLTPTTFVGAEFDPDTLMAGLAVPDGLTPEDLELTLAFRQFGFSNSMSQQHLDQIANDPNNPLLWVNEDFDVFMEQLTAVQLGDTVYLGDAFFDETQTAGGLFDTETTDQQVDSLADYQQIMSTYTESMSLVGLEVDPDLQFFLEGIGAQFGVDEINAENGTPNGDFENPFPQNTDASNFADFAGVGGPVNDVNADLPPEGKQGAAGPGGLSVVRDPFGTSGFIIPLF